MRPKILFDSGIVLVDDAKICRACLVEYQDRVLAKPSFQMNDLHRGKQRPVYLTKTNIEHKLHIPESFTREWQLQLAKAHPVSEKDMMAQLFCKKIHAREIVRVLPIHVPIFLFSPVQRHWVSRGAQDSTRDVIVPCLHLSPSPHSRAC